MQHLFQSLDLRRNAEIKRLRILAHLHWDGTSMRKAAGFWLGHMAAIKQQGTSSNANAKLP
ncbi:MAG: hypothetical protein HHJ12_14965 [Glaciimonas sp.]|nr:hypothetical protein [Glaciimonas sp.]